MKDKKVPEILVKSSETGWHGFLTGLCLGKMWGVHIPRFVLNVMESKHSGIHTIMSQAKRDVSFSGDKAQLLFLRSWKCLQTCSFVIIAQRSFIYLNEYQANHKSYMGLEFYNFKYVHIYNSFYHHSNSSQKMKLIEKLNLKKQSKWLGKSLFSNIKFHCFKQHFIVL